MVYQKLGVFAGHDYCNHSSCEGCTTLTCNINMAIELFSPDLLCMLRFTRGVNWSGWKHHTVHRPDNRVCVSFALQSNDHLLLFCHQVTAKQPPFPFVSKFHYFFFFCPSHLTHSVLFFPRQALHLLREACCFSSGIFHTCHTPNSTC